MCVSMGRKPRIQPPPPAITKPPEPPDFGSQAEAEAERRRVSTGRRGVSGFRVDLTAPTGGSGVNVPGN